MWNWKSHGLIRQLILAYCKYVCISKQKKEKIPQTCWKLPQFVHQRLFKTVFWFLFSSVTVNWISLWTVDFVWGRHVGLFETLINIFVLRYSCNEHLTTIINRLVLKKIKVAVSSWTQLEYSLKFMSALCYAEQMGCDLTSSSDSRHETHCCSCLLR